jgi:integrase
MKPTGAHPHKKLSPPAVAALTKPGRYSDGNGLYLVVSPTGNKKWILRTVVQGRRTDIGLGGISTTTLAKARKKAAELREIARDGGNPLEERRKANRNVPTFKEAAKLVHEDNKTTWKNEKHAAQWINTLKTYAYPYFGDLRVDQIGTAEVLQALSKIWLTKPETARRVRQRIGTIMDWAKAAGHRSGDNPIDGIQFEFLVLTATRTVEVQLAEWSEIDFENKTWTIPDNRMKAGRIFRVPLSARCLQILEEAKGLSDGSGYIFPGLRKGKPLSNNTFLKALQRMERAVTAHGFRSTFRDWANERTNFPYEVGEMALAHTVSDKTEAAYLRGDLFDKRRELMDTLSNFVTEEKAKVVTIRKSSA